MAAQMHSHTSASYGHWKSAKRKLLIPVSQQNILHIYFLKVSYYNSLVIRWKGS